MPEETNVNEVEETEATEEATEDVSVVDETADTCDGDCEECGAEEEDTQADSAADNQPLDTPACETDPGPATCGAAPEPARDPDEIEDSKVGAEQSS
jgi:hypothetical protein